MQQTQTRLVKVIGFGNAVEPEREKHRHKHRTQTETPGHTGRVQDKSGIVQTLECRHRKILEVVRVVVWEQVLEGWHRLDDRNCRPLLRQNSNRRIHQRLEIQREHDVLGSSLIDEMGNGRGRIPRRNREDGTLGTDDSERSGGVGDRVWTSRYREPTW